MGSVQTFNSIENKLYHFKNKVVNTDDGYENLDIKALDDDKNGI